MIKTVITVIMTEIITVRICPHPVKLAQCYYADIAGLPDLAEQSNVPIKSDRANLDRIKTLIIGLRGAGQCDTELTQ